MAKPLSPDLIPLVEVARQELADQAKDAQSKGHSLRDAVAFVVDTQSKEHDQLATALTLVRLPDRRVAAGIVGRAMTMSILRRIAKADELLEPASEWTLSLVVFGLVAHSPVIDVSELEMVMEPLGLA